MKALYRCFLAVAALSTGTAALADYVVVRATGPSSKAYPVGRHLSDNSRVELQSGDALLLLGPSSSRQLRGPGNFVIGAQQAIAFNSRGRFGAKRTLFLTPSPWDLDVTKGGAVCVADPAEFGLWRLDAAEAIQLHIEGDDKRNAVMEWPANEAKLAWPNQLPIRDGAEYRLRTDEKSDAIIITLRTLPAVPHDRLSTAQAMIERQCTAQLDTLIRGAPLEE